MLILEPVNMLLFMGKGTLQMWLRRRPYDGKICWVAWVGPVQSQRPLEEGGRRVREGAIMTEGEVRVMQEEAPS